MLWRIFFGRDGRDAKLVEADSEEKAILKIPKRKRPGITRVRQVRTTREWEQLRKVEAATKPQRKRSVRRSKKGVGT